MNKFIIEEDLVNLFIKKPDWNKFKNKFQPILHRGIKKYPLVFEYFHPHILNNLYWISNFHKAYTEGADLNRLDKGVELFIKAINFPGDLE